VTHHVGVGWAVCRKSGCIGSQLARSAWCLAHAAKCGADAFGRELEPIGERGTVDGRGVQVRAELLKQLLAAVPQVDGRPLLTADFTRAAFQDDAEFTGTRFKGPSTSAERASRPAHASSSRHSSLCELPRRGVESVAANPPDAAGVIADIERRGGCLPPARGRVVPTVAFCRRRRSVR
jgi:hypothetical protein